MSKLFNIRIEKKEQSKLKVVDIREYLRKKIRTKFEQYMLTADNMIIISKSGRKRMVYSSYVESDTIYELEKVKKAFLE